jgi:predicted metal-dependent phosphoesterase TrpH
MRIEDNEAYIARAMRSPSSVIVLQHGLIPGVEGRAVAYVDAKAVNIEGAQLCTEDEFRRWYRPQRSLWQRIKDVFQI